MAKKKFEELSIEEQRVEIAKDVLKQVNVGRYLPSRGVYVRALVRKEVRVDDTQVCDLLGRKKCEVCGLGALMLSTIDKANHLRVKDLYRHGSSSIDLFNTLGLPRNVDTYLDKFFSVDQRKLIERGFENWSCGDNYYHENEFDPVVRMTLVMENIIANNGTFVPFNKKGESQ